MPPLSSKKRSAITVACVGTPPSNARPATTYSTACSAPASSRPHSSVSQFAAARTPASICSPELGEARGTNALIFSRKSETWAESSSVRAGASPRQNGMFGAAPCASSTKTLPEWTKKRKVDRKSTRLNSSHGYISYAVFCLKKKKKKKNNRSTTVITKNTTSRKHSTPVQATHKLHR